MKTTKKRTRRSFISAIILAVAALAPQTSSAAHPVAPAAAGNTYNIAVTYHRYDGQSGHDAQGNHTYRVKVQHGHSQYYIYLHTPLPQVKGHMHQKITVIASKNSDRWLTLSVHGNSARIHRVVKITAHHDHH